MYGAALGGLLILLEALIMQLDGEQRLDTGVQVERFTGPAGSDGLGVWMVETSNLSQSITLGSALLSERKVQMPGELLVTDPGLAELTVRFGKYPCVAIPTDHDFTLVDDGVVPLAQQDQIV
jgi:hypothetical protein